MLGDEMSFIERKDGVPFGFNVAFSEYPYGMNPFETLTEEEKRTVTGRTHSSTLDEELRSMLDSYKAPRSGMREPKGPVQQ